MFSTVLIVILTTGGIKSPTPIATFRSDTHCEAVAAFINKGFVEQGGQNRALCISALKWGEI
jgi:hypothetical protein